MKKTYIQPSIEAVKIQQSIMLGGSETLGSNSITDQSKILSKRNDFGEVEFED